MAGETAPDAAGSVNPLEELSPEDLAVFGEELAEAELGPDEIQVLEHDHALHEATWGELFDAWELFQDPILSGSIAGLVLGFLSVYIVLRRMVFVSAGITQAAGLGVAFSYYAAIHLGFAINPRYGAIAGALIGTALLVPDPRRLGLSREMVLGMVYALAAGAAILVGSRISQEAHDIQSILFGYAVLVIPQDFHGLVGASCLVLFFHLWWFRGLTFATFDATSARVQGLPVRLLDSVLLVSIGIMIGVTARTQGALPAFAFSTMPGMAALLITRGRVAATFVLAALFGAVAGVAGYLFAFFYDFSVGSAQTVVAVAMVGAALVVRTVVNAVSGSARTPR